MTTRLQAVLLAAALLVPGLARAQDDGAPEPGTAEDSAHAAPGAKDQKKAAKLVEDNASFKKLSPKEQQAILDYLSFQESAVDEEIDSASLITLKGETLEAIEAGRKGSSNRKCDAVLTQEKCVETKPQPAFRWVSKTVELPPFSELFKDNEWVYQDGSAEDLKLQADLKNLADLVTKQHGRVDSIDIQSSASTLKNTRGAAALSHEQLSKKRAESARDAVKKYLAADGVASPDDAKIALDYLGKNHNGTSGPSSPFECPSCPKGDGPAPSKKELLKFFNSARPDGAPEAPDSAVAPDAPGAGADSAGPSVFKSKTLDTLGKGAAAPGKAPEAEGGAKCTAEPVPPSMSDLYRAYYNQFKYVAVSFVVSWPVRVEEQPAAVKDCSAREVLVCIHVARGDVPPKKKHHQKKYLGRRIKRWFRCLFVDKHNACSPFDCR